MKASGVPSGMTVEAERAGVTKPCGCAVCRGLGWIRPGARCPGCRRAYGDVKVRVAKKRRARQRRQEELREREARRQSRLRLLSLEREYGVL